MWTARENRQRVASLEAAAKLHRTRGEIEEAQECEQAAREISAYLDALDRAENGGER